MSTYRKFDWNRARKDYATLFTDFFNYVTGEWTTTVVGTGTSALADAAGGVLVVTTSGADNDGRMAQWAGNGGATKETFKFATDKKLQFVGRFKLSDATDCDFFAGLYITDTDPVGGVSDGIYFRKLDGTNKLSFVVEKDAAETVIEVGTLTNGAYFDVEFYWDANGDKIDVFFNGTRVGGVVTTNAPNDEDLALSYGVQAGSAAARTLNVDYIGAQQQR